MACEIVFRVPAGLSRRGSVNGDVDIPLTVDSDEALGSVYNRLLLPHLRNCCPLGYLIQSEEAKAAEVGVRAVGNGTAGRMQEIRLMDSTQRVLLPPDLAVGVIARAWGSPIHVLPKEPPPGGGVDWARVRASMEMGIRAASLPTAASASSAAAAPASAVPLSAVTSPPAAAVPAGSAAAATSPSADCMKRGFLPPCSGGGKKQTAGGTARSGVMTGEGATPRSHTSSDKTPQGNREEERIRKELRQGTKGWFMEVVGFAKPGEAGGWMGVGTAERGGGEEIFRKPQLMSLTDMIHHVDVRNGWAITGCECCLERAVGYCGQRTLDLMTFKRFLTLLGKTHFASLPETPQNTVISTILEYSAGVPLLGERSEPYVQFCSKAQIAPFMCAQGMLLEWLAEPRVGVLMDLGKVRSRLPAIFAGSTSAAAVGAPVAELSAVGSSAAAAAAALWSCCWRCSSCWAAYRRALSFATFFVLVARWPRFVTLWRAHVDTSRGILPALVGELGGMRLVKQDTFASMLVQILGVKDRVELNEGFGFYVQHLLSGGLEKAHAQGKAASAVSTRGARGADGGRRKGKEKEVGSSKEPLVGGRPCEGDGQEEKDGEWREHLRGPVWERYVDGMGGILKHGGGEGRAFRCSHCCGDSGRNISHIYSGGGGVPKGMYLSGVGATDLALTVATVLSQPQHWKEAQCFTLDSSNAAKTRVENAAIETAREKQGSLRRALREAGMNFRPFKRAEMGARASVPPPPLAASTATSPSASTHSAGGGDGGCGCGSGSGSGSGSDSASVSTGAIPGAILTPERVPVTTNVAVAAMTYRASCLLTWVRIYGSDSILRKQCLKDSPQAKVLPMRHPLRDIPSLLLRFGDIPRPLEGDSFPLEWDEWPQGHEAAAKFPVNPTARCFGLGVVEKMKAAEKSVPTPSKQQSPAGEKASASKARGAKAAMGGRLCAAIDGEQTEVFVALPRPREKFPIVRCQADIDFLIGFAAVLMEPPACSRCLRCTSSYTRSVSAAALMATFAYRPVSILFNRLVSLFPRHSPEYMKLQRGLCFPACIRAPVSVLVMQERAEEMPLGFLMNVALWWSEEVVEMKELLGGGGQAAAKRGKVGARGKAGGRGKGGEGEEDGGEVWEEVRMWCLAALMAWQPLVWLKGAPEACNGSKEQEEASRSSGGVMDLSRLMREAVAPRFCEGFEDQARLVQSTGKGLDCGSGSSSSGDAASRSSSRSSSSRRGEGGGRHSSEGKDKKEEVAAYLKPWPGGVNVVACLREMLLGEPCYLPPSHAAAPFPAAAAAAASITAAPTTSAAPATASPPTPAAPPSAATPPTPAAPSTVAAASVGGAGAARCATHSSLSSPAPVSNAPAASPRKRFALVPCGTQVRGAEGCGRVEGGDGNVKLKGCGACGKVAYCSRDCQKAHWPSHKLTCPGRSSSKGGGVGTGTTDPVGRGKG